MKLCDEIAEAIRPIMHALPADQAMAQLVVVRGGSRDLAALVERVVAVETIQKRPPLAARLWLYVDEPDRSHRFSQSIDDETGAFWHGIMHRREGDFSNSHYRFRRTAAHPVTRSIPGYDPHEFIDEAARRHREAPEDLVMLQRLEWQTLFEWCAEHW